MASIGLLAISQADASGFALPVLEVTLLGHVFFLLRGVWRFRRQEAVSRPVELLWAIPILILSWWFSTMPVPDAPPAFLRAVAYVITAVSFALTPGSVGGRAILSSSFFFWASERRCHGFRVPELPDRRRCRGTTAMPTSSKCSWR